MSHPISRFRSAAIWTLLGVVLLVAILVPFFLYEEAILQWTNRALQRGVAPGTAAGIVFSLLALDILLPVPSSLVNTAAGALLGFLAGAVIAWAGMTAGCTVGYLLGRRAGRATARRVVGERELDRVSQAAAHWGGAVVVLLRAVPVLAEASVVWAGLTAMPFAAFLLRVAAANAGIALVYAAVGAFALHARSFLLAFAAAIALPALGLFAARRL